MIFFLSCGYLSIYLPDYSSFPARQIGGTSKPGEKLIRYGILSAPLSFMDAVGPVAVTIYSFQRQLGAEVI